MIPICIQIRFENGGCATPAGLPCRGRFVNGVRKVGMCARVELDAILENKGVSRITYVYQSFFYFRSFVLEKYFNLVRERFKHVKFRP